MALYAKSGFRTVGIYHEQGQQVGRHDRDGEALVGLRARRQRTRTVTTTDIPARRVCGLLTDLPSRWILTGTR